MRKNLSILLLVVTTFMATQFSAAALPPVQAPLPEGVSISFENNKYTVRWRKVSDATSYLFSVFTRDFYGGDKTYIYNKRETTKLGVAMGTSKMKEGKQYFVEISSKRLDEVSDPCIEVPLVPTPLTYSTMPVPEGFKIEKQDANYALSWQPVTLASSYKVNRYSNEVMTHKGRYTFTENFNNILEGTLEEPVEFLYGGLQLADYCGVPDWSGSILAMANGGVVIQNKAKGFGWSYLDGPLMTLGNDRSGDFSVDVTVQSQANDSVQVKLYESLDGKYNKVQLLESQIKEMPSNACKLSFDFTKGKPNCFVSIEVHTATTINALVDEVSIHRDLMQGEEMKMLNKVDVVTGRSLMVPVSEITKPNVYYSFDVASQAYSKKLVASRSTQELRTEEEPYLGLQAEAFKGATKLVEIILPQNTEGIGKNAFAGCTALKKVTVAPATPSKWGFNAFPDQDGLVIYVANEAIKQSVEAQYEFTKTRVEVLEYSSVEQTMNGKPYRVAIDGNQITIAMNDAKAQVAAFDLMGRNMGGGNLKAHETWTKTLAPGVYVITINNESLRVLIK